MPGPSNPVKVRECEQDKSLAQSYFKDWPLTQPWNIARRIKQSNP